MKKIGYVILVGVVIVAGILFMRGKEAGKDSTDLKSQFAARGWVLSQDVAGKLNDDSYDDHVLLFEKATSDNTNERLLVILLSKSDGHYSTSLTSTTAIDCSTCGGVGGNGDPLEDLNVVNGELLIVYSRGALQRSRESNYYSFDQGSWKLVRKIVESYDANNPEKISTVTQTTKDFGQITLENTSYL